MSHFLIVVAAAVLLYGGMYLIMAAGGTPLLFPTPEERRMQAWLYGLGVPMMLTGLVVAMAVPS